MTPRQSEILAFVLKWQCEKPYSPTVKEISTGTGVGVNATMQALWDLEDLGHLRRRGRALALVNEPVTFARIEKGPKVGSNIRLPSTNAPSLGSLLATFDRMHNATEPR